MSHQHLDIAQDDHDRGLQHDLQVISRQLAERRRLLGYMMGGGALMALTGCGGGDDVAATVVDSGSSSSSSSSSSTSTSTSSSSSSSSSTVSSCVADPVETNGPYPSDGTNNANGVLSNVLTQTGVVRSDIRSSFGSSSNTAPGVPLTFEITVVNSNSSCEPLAGWAVYVWHCTRDGLYSLYSSGVQNENFLRGVQVSDTSGKMTFTTIFPGCYSGRYPHIHFEVFQSLGVATGKVNSVLVSQMAMPRDICSTVYSSATGYSASVNNLAGVTLASDGIFGDNTAAQVAQQTMSMTGSVAAGYNGSIVIE